MPKGWLRSGITAAFDQDLWQALQLTPAEKYEIDNTVVPALNLGLLKGTRGTPALPAAISAERDGDDVALLVKIVNADAHWLKLDGSNANANIDIRPYRMYCDTIWTSGDIRFLTVGTEIQMMNGVITGLTTLVVGDYKLDLAGIYANTQSRSIGASWNPWANGYINRLVSGTATLAAAGPTDDYDASGINTLFIDCSSNAVTIGGFVGGQDGQILHIARLCAAGFAATLEHNEGTGNQDIFLHAGADETLTGEYGGWTLACNGSDWYDLSHAKHV